MLPLASESQLGTRVHFICHYLHRINSNGIWYGDNPLSFTVPAILFQLSLISIVTGLIHFLLRPFGQPLIISQILGGIVLGPSLFGRNKGSFLHKVFPMTNKVVLDSLSFFGLMLFIFSIGVKVDPTMVFRTGKRALFIGILGFFVPYALTSLAALLLKHFSSLDYSLSIVLYQIALMQSMTAFPVITCFLDELQILNSEIGRLASSSSIICDVCHWSILSVRVVAELVKSTSVKATIYSILSGSLFISFIVFGIRPAALWAVRQTPEGKPVREIYIFAVLIALLSCAFIGEAIGLSALVASLILGLVIPDGPPLGAALVEKLDCFVSVLLMPLFFAHCGLQMDVYSIQNLSNVGLVQLLVLVGFLGKMAATILPPLFCRMPFRDALSFSLIMNTKGIIELAILSDYRSSHVMSKECYAIMIISVVVTTGAIAPLVKVLYDPSKRFLAYRRRTILHLRHDEELRILACLHNQENIPAIVSLLQVSNPSKESPIDLVILHLIRLMGRAASVLVAYQQRETPSRFPSQSERIFSVFHSFERQNESLLAVHCYKGISPHVTMHNDVCSLALEKRSILIIVPFHKQWTYRGVESSYSHRHLNRNILNKAPCSVGILVDRNGTHKKGRYVMVEPLVQRVAVLFLGGADDREALAFGKRMSGNPNVKLTLIRFISSSGAEIVGGKERSKTLDASILSEFKHHTLKNDRVYYQEEVVANGSAVVSMARSVVTTYDLVMVGRRHAESHFMNQLHKWSESGELGAIGEILAAPDFQGGSLVFVMQQQTKLWGLRDPEESTHLRRVSL